MVPKYLRNAVNSNGHSIKVIFLRNISSRFRLDMLNNNVV